MNRELIIRPEAQDDLAEAFAWYERRRPDLGVDLMREVETSLVHIEQRPESFPTLHEDVRRALTKRFPYGIYFILPPQGGIVVIAIFHVRRDPRAWKSRA
jgi:toxin ParE1/3/4